MINLMRRSIAIEQSRELSPARQALADHLDSCREAGQRAADLGAAERAAHEAERSKTKAQATLDAVAEAEAAALREWSHHPTGAMPAPLSLEREKAIAALAPLHTAAVSARRNADSLAHEVNEAHLSIARLVAQVPKFVQAALIEEAGILAESYYQAILTA